MTTNPLFTGDEPSTRTPDPGYILSQPPKRIEPLAATSPQVESNPAIELIRRKVQALYDDEPDAAQELAEVKQEAPTHPSKHQRFMLELNQSGKPFAHIQTEWHNYYINLPEHEKHEVWREFYAANTHSQTPYAKAISHQPATATEKTLQPRRLPKLIPIERPDISKPKPDEPKAIVVDYGPPVAHKKPRSRRASSEIRKRVLKKVGMNERAQAKAKQHLQSLLFGLGVGVLAIVITLFSFFNEFIISPFIRPNNLASATPIILNNNGVAPSETPEVIVPKINVQIPVIYNLKSLKENAIQDSLEDGVIHYPTTVMPGQQGNAAFFGHSSNNIFNKGKYKFAFVLLHELVPGDIFYLTHDKKVYAYKVYDRKVVLPSEVSVIQSVPGKAATATLITCDPPGSSSHRLVVWGEQISPDPAGNIAATTDTTIDEARELPSNGPTLWRRFIDSIF